MENYIKINENISRLTIPYKDIYTTVYLIKTDGGYVLFDAASYHEDVKEYLLPFLSEANVNEDALKYIFISHNHKDHAGGLEELIKYFPKSIIVSRSPGLKETFIGHNFVMPEDRDIILNDLMVVTIPGHTTDSSALYDTRTKTLITGDCMQLYGIFGSGMWGSNIRLPYEHLEALQKLRKLDIEAIYAAHDYHPYGYNVQGKDAVLKYIAACEEPLFNIKKLIVENLELDDEEITEKYNSPGNVPKIGVWVAEAMRAAVKEGKIK